jgi:hypothetical protein
MPGARVFGVVLGTAEEPTVAYLDRAIPVEQLDLEVDPTQVGQFLRIAAECAGDSCVHFDDDSCSLGDRVASDVPSVVSMLPRCSIRRDCRWFAEQGGDVCGRCPQLVTADRRRPGNEAVAMAAQPEMESSNGVSR